MHNVYFWLKPDADKDLMEKGLRLLGTVPVVQSYHWGAPAESKKRDVLRDDYDYAINVKLANQADNEVYAVHPIHLEFIEMCKHLWTKVEVFDNSIEN